MSLSSGQRRKKYPIGLDRCRQVSIVIGRHRSIPYRRIQVYSI